MSWLKFSDGLCQQLLKVVTAGCAGSPRQREAALILDKWGDSIDGDWGSLSLFLWGLSSREHRCFSSAVFNGFVVFFVFFAVIVGFGLYARIFSDHLSPQVQWRKTAGHSLPTDHPRAVSRTCLPTPTPWQISGCFSVFQCGTVE